MARRACRHAPSASSSRPDLGRAHFYEAALEAWPENDPNRAWLLLDTGRARHAAERTGIEFLEQAFEQLRSTGDADGAAEAAVELSRCLWERGDSTAARSYADQALAVAKRGMDSRARAQALVARAVYHMTSSESEQAIAVAHEALQLTEAFGLHDLTARALDVLGISRVTSGDSGGLADSRRAIALARESNAFFALCVAEYNLHFAHFVLAECDQASETLQAFRRDVESYGTAVMARFWLPCAEAREAVIRGDWDDAGRMLDGLIAESDAGLAHYLDPALRALRALIDLGHDDIEAALARSEKAVERARTTSDPQVLAPALGLRAMVLFAHGQTARASSIASELLAIGPVAITGLLELLPAATPIEVAWLMRDLRQETELRPLLAQVPLTPWVRGAHAIVEADYVGAVDAAVSIGAPSIEAYTRLRAGEAMFAEGRSGEAARHLESALAFYQSARATRYVQRAKALLGDPQRSLRSSATP
jgi:tetratricopeptide (TPR) repeat protein